MDIPHQLVESIRNRSAILFVGAGISMNLSLPSFRQLIAHLAEELGYDPELFETYGDFRTLAEFYLLQRGRIGPLRAWADRKWHEGVDISSSEIHRLIVELGFPIIYTTNYDRLLEFAFDHAGKPYQKIVTVRDFVLTDHQSTQIVKFHGDFDDDDSIVLAESSYFERMSFDSPLDIKLRADAVGRTILFLGYSLADVNIRLLLYTLYKQWARSGHSAARPTSYILLGRSNPIEETVLKSRGVVPLVSAHDDPGIGLLEFLRELAERTEKGEKSNI